MLTSGLYQPTKSAVLMFQTFPQARAAARKQAKQTGEERFVVREPDQGYDVCDEDTLETLYFNHGDPLFSTLD